MTPRASGERHPQADERSDDMASPVLSVNSRNSIGRHANNVDGRLTAVFRTLFAFPRSVRLHPRPVVAIIFDDILQLTEWS